MKDIDKILAKHFAGETNSEEESVLETWKAQNTEQYNALSEAWKEYDGSLSHVNFDSKRAWKVVGKELVKGTSKFYLLPSKVFKYGIAASLIFALGTFLLLQMTNSFSINKELIVFENHDTSAKKITLPDNSHVWLNQYAKISYDSETGNERKTTLFGEAFFEVKKDSLHRFVIATKHGTITVLGTSFNVNSNDSVSCVSVNTGKVRLVNSKDSMLLSRGETATIRQTEISGVKKSDLNYLSWKTGEFVFENSSLQEVIKCLNTYYKNRFASSNIDCRVTARFKNNTIEEIAETLSLICGCKIKYQGKTILFE